MEMSFSPGRKWAAETHLEEIMSKIASVLGAKVISGGEFKEGFCFGSKWIVEYHLKQIMSKISSIFGAKYDLSG